MTDDTKRRTVVAVATTLLAGCTTLNGEQSQGSNSKKSSDPDRPSNCALHHELTDEDSAGYEVTNLTYENLSTDARYLVERTVENDGYVTENESRDPPEFEYDDTTSRYRIERNDTTYLIITYSGSGC